MATLASLIALKTWETTGFSHKIDKGLKFLQENMEELVKMRMSEDWGAEAELQTWFLMVELAKAKGLEINDVEYKMNLMKFKRKKGEIIERVVMREIAFGMCINSEHFGSPSAAACAFMITGDKAYRSYLQHLDTYCQEGVPFIYIVDEDVRQLYVVDNLKRIGGAEHFTEKITDVMDHQYRKWMVEESKSSKKDDPALQLYKDSLAFRLLRMHGYQVSPWRFCWCFDDAKMLSYIKQNHAFFFGSMYSIYKASKLAFPEDHMLKDVGLFAGGMVVMGISSIESQNYAKIPANIN